MIQSLRTGGSELSEEQVTDLLTRMYDSTQTVREDLKKNVRKEIFEQLKTIDGSLNEDVLNNMVITDKEIRNEEGEVVSGKGTAVKTKDDGSLYFVIDKETAADDGKSTTYTMKIANPDVVGTSSLGEFYVNAKVADVDSDEEYQSTKAINSIKDSPSALAMEMAGKITFTVNEENGSLTIDSVQIQNDSSSLKKQAVQELSDMFPEYNITWENQTESDKKVFADIESGNPRNTSQKTYGLNYREKISSDDADTAYVKRCLGNKFSEDNSENSLMATILQSAAKARGLSGREFIEKYLTEIRDVTDTQYKDDPYVRKYKDDKNTKGFTVQRRDEVKRQVKATIYAGLNADPTTFLHELHHVIMLMDENMKEFTGIYQKVKGTKQFKAFLKKNVDILFNSPTTRKALAEEDKDGKFVRDEKGRCIVDESKLDSLFQSGDKWTEGDFEIEARIYEAYVRSGQTFNPTLTGFFRRVAETFRQIYYSLRNGFSSVRLNDEVVEYFDKLYGYDKQTGTTSKLSGSGELFTTSERITGEEKTDALKQEDSTEPSVEEVQAELEKLSPVDVMAVDSVDESFKNKKDKSADTLRRRKNWAKSVTPMGLFKSPIGDVLISNNSINDSVAPSHGTNRYTASLYPHLDKLLENSVYATTTERKNEDRYILVSKFRRPSGEIGYVGIVVRKNRENNIYYFHSVIKNEGGQGVATNSSGPETAPSSMSNVLRKYLPVKDDVLKQDQSPAEQYEAVKAQYYGTDKYMIAPDGKASNLTEDQWIWVRTPNFKKWAGDWENDPEHASVILDENGEPKQLYHGSPSTGIEVFNNSERSINGGEKGFTYLTDNANVADRFSREFEEGSSAFRVRLTGRVGEVYSLYAKMSSPLDFRNLTEQNKNDIAETYVDDVFGADAKDRAFQIEQTKSSIENALRHENYQLIKGYAKSYLDNLESYGYDGIIAPMGTRGELKEPLEYAVSSANQVKSAVKNSGQFSLGNDSILKQEADILFQSVVPEDFSEQIDRITKNDIGTKDKAIVFSESTPRVFLSLGLNNLPVEMYIDKLARGLTLEENEAHGHADGLSKDIVKNVCKNLGNPLAVFDSASVKGRLVALYDIEDLKGDGIIISITPDAKKSNAIEVNLISSIYGKENKSVFKKWIDSGLLRYVDNTNRKSLALRLQLPSTKTLYMDNVLTKSQLVNNFVTEQMETILKQEGGYDYQRHMSNRAVAAYESEEMPISKWTRTELDSAIRVSSSSKEVSDILTSLPIEAKRAMLNRSSWHHTGIFYKATDFYEMPDLSDVTVEQAQKYADAYKKYKTEEKTYNKAKKEAESNLKENQKLTETYHDGGTRIAVSTYGNVLEGVVIPDDIGSFAEKELLYSQSGNAYIRGTKPRTRDVENGLQRLELRDDGKTVALTEYDAESDEYKTLSTLNLPKAISDVKDLHDYLNGTYKGSVISTEYSKETKPYNLDSLRYILFSSSLLRQEDDSEKQDGPKYKTVDEAEAALTEYRKKNGVRIDENAVRVNAADVHELYRLAENAREEFSETINKLQKDLGVPDDMAFSRTSLKGFDRVIEKTVNDYDGDVGRVIDVNGATFMTDYYSTAESYFNKVISILGDRVVKKKKCITPAGYKDFKVNFRTSNGFIGELIIIDEDTAWIKNNGIGHAIYEESRRLDPYLKKDKNAFKEYQKLFGMDVWSAISKLNESLDEWSSVVYANAKTIRYGQYDSAGFTANLYAVSSDITELSLQLRSNFAASYSDGSSSYTLPSDATLSMDTSPDAESLLNAVSQISKYLTAMLNSSTQNVSQLETEVKNKEDLDALQTRSQQNITEIAVSGDSLKQIGDDEWTETAKRIALEAPSLEDFFRLYRERIESGEMELGDSNTALLLSDIYDESKQGNYEDFDESYFDSIESEDEVDEDDFWKVEDEEPSESAASASDSSEEVPDWFDLDKPEEDKTQHQTTQDTAPVTTEAESTEEDEDDFWKIEDDESSAATASSTASTGMPDDVPDWFDLDAEETSATETEQSIKEVEDAVTEIQKVVVDSDLPSKLSLDHSRSLDTSLKARSVEFASILRESKEETIRFLETLKRVNAEFFYQNPEASGEITSEEDYQMQQMRKSAYDDFGSISKLIQNLIFDSKGASVSRNLNNLSDRAWKIVAGQVARNAEVYMDLYSRAANNPEWAGDASIEAQVLQELGLSEQEWDNLSFYKRKMFMQDIADKELRERIMSGKVYDADLRDWIRRAEAKAEASLAEAKAIEESQKYIISEDKKTILRLSTGAKDAQKKIADLQTEQEEVQEKIDKLVIRMENKLKKNGTPTQEETLLHSELKKRQNQLKKRQTQYENALKAWQNKNLKKADTKALTAELDRVRQLYKEAQDKVTELLNKNDLTPEEALERLENLYSTWQDTKLKDAIDKVKDHYEDRLEQAAKDRKDALKKQEKKIGDIYKQKLKNATKNKNDALKKAHKAYMQEMRQRDALRRVRQEKERLAKQIMKAPSSNVALEESKQIKAVQALIDPAYRRRTMKTIDGVKYTVDELKRILNSNPQDPVLQKLTERQLERLTKVSLDEMSMAEVETTYQYILKLREDGLNKRRSEILQRKTENQVLMSSLLTTLRANPNFTEYGFEGTEDKKNRENTKKNKIRDAWYQTLNMARKAQTLDNGEKGVFYDLLIRKKRLLQSEEMKNVMARSKKIEDVIKDYKLGDSLYKTWSVKLEDGRSVTFTTSELGYIYLSRNNEDNRDAVAYGTLVNTEERMNIIAAAEKAIVGTGKNLIDARNNKIDADIRALGDWRYNAVLKLATEVIEKDKGMLTLVKAIEADFNEPSFDRVINLVRKLYNVEVKKQQYYLPINRTDFLGKEPGEDIKNDLLNQIPGTKGNIQKGFTKDRLVIAPRNQEAVKYDLFKVWTNAVKNQEHFLAMQEYVNQLNSIFVTSNTKTNTLRANIRNTYGEGMLESIDTHIKEIADPDAGAVQADPAKDILRAARGNIYSAYLGFKLSSITNQLITSPAAFFGKVGPVRYAKNLLQMANPFTFKKTREEVFKLSPFMKSRNFDIIAGEIKEAAEAVGMPKYKKAWYNFLDFGLSGLEWADQVTVISGWKAIYEQELQKLGEATDENIRKAVQIADEYVQETQPQSDKTEIAPLFKNKNSITTTLLQFQSSLNVVWNNLAYDTVHNFKRKDWRTAFGTIFGYATAGAVLSLAHGDFQPDGDDDDYSFWRTFLYSTVSQGIESVPLVSGSIDSVFSYVLKDEELGYNASTITPFPMLGEAVKSGYYVTKSIREQSAEYIGKAIEKGANAFMLGTGLPYSGIKELKAIQDTGVQALIGAR